MKFFSRAARTLILAIAAVAATTLGARQLCSSDQMDQQTARLVAQMIPAFHLTRRPIDDTVSAALVDGYIQALDPQKLYFLQSDIDSFSRYRTTLDDALQTGNVDFAYQVFEVFRERATRQCELAHKLIDAEHDFTVNEELIADPKERSWAASQAELDERWRKWIKRDLLEFRLDDKPLEEARQELHKRYRNIKLLRVDQQRKMDTLEMYLTELAQCYDPHSSYMSPSTWEDFEISFRLSLDGIGAELRPDDGYTVVHSIVPGGAADKDGRLKPNDKILGVGQAEGEIVNIYEMKLTDVVRMIRGPSGSLVRLQVKPADGGETRIYELTRQKIELSAQAVKGEIIETQDRVGRPGKIGVVHVPSFYRDFEGAAAGGDFKSASADVAAVLQQFNEANVDAVVVDLRWNGGGALSEAIEMSGHFIDRGPVVQVKDERGGVKQLNDEQPGVLTNKPVIVVCNRLSASASEIFAGVIKDYRRGIVVGDSTTHGKGTVQNLMDVVPNQVFAQLLQNKERGKLKLTINQFYRVNGDSTQNRGVRSDVVLPSLLDHADLGESFLENPLPFDQIDPAQFSAGRYVSPELVALLQRNSEERVAQNKEFQDLQSVIERYLERKNRKTITLNEAQARADRAKETEDAESEALLGEDQEAEGTPKKDQPVFPDRYYENEVLNIALDYIAALRGGATAAANGSN